MVDDSDGGDDTGNPSLDGWFYQCDVSVWAALDLLLVKRLASTVQLEPASQEDIEAELDSPTVASTIGTDTGLLVVQSKLRRSGPWTPATLRKLVKHGKKRPSAATRLADPSVRYVLVTSADVTGPLQSLLVEDFVELQSLKALPDVVFPPSLVKHAAGRFAVLGLQTERRTLDRIELMLMNPLCVPLPRLEACRNHLRSEAMDRMRNGQPWLRAELEVAVKAFGGSIPSDDVDDFVQPDCWPDIVAQMDARHAVVLTGPSGTGKTTAARALGRHLKALIPGLDVVDVSGGPAEIRRRAGDGPTLFHVEDPWGKYEITREKLPWSTDLKQLLLSASVRQMFVITTRSDILGEAVGESDFLRKWTVTIQPEDYGPKGLQKLYENRLPRLPTGTLRTAAADARRQVLNRLSTPFEIDRFFRHMARGPTADDPTEMAFVSRVLEDTQRDSIEDEVALLVDARGSHHWAAVVWALMKSRGGLSRGDLPNVRRSLAALDPSFRDGLEDFVNALVAGGHLRQPTSNVTYAHPRVELGLVSAMRTRVGTAEHALSSLVTALVGLDTSSDRRGSETAAHVFAAMVKASPRWDDVTHEARAAIDRWLDDSLMQEAEDYASMMRLAATVGSDASISARLARWFRPAASGAGFFMRSWRAPKHPEEWYESVRSHPCTARICDQFIRKVLTVESRGYPTRMPEHIDRLAVGLDSAYMSAAMSVVGKGYEPNVDVIAFGAMRSPQNREALLAAAMEARSRTQFQPFDEKERWASEDGHHNDDWGEHLADDEGASADQILEAYVAATRKDVGWQHLASHIHLHDLASTWIRLLSGTPSEDLSDDELQAVIGIAWGQAIESSVWSLAQDVWRPSLERPLLSRIRAGHADRAIRMSAALCALVSAPRLLVDAAKELASAGQMIELLKLAFDVWSSVVGAPGRKSKIRKYMRFVKELPSPCGEIARAFTSHSGLRHSQFGPDGTEVILRAIDQSDEDLHALLVWLATANGHVRPEEIQRVIACVDRPERARIGLRAAIDSGLWDLVESAVSHPRADIRQHALEALVSRSGGIVQTPLLKLANDPGSRVRQALVDALSVTPSPGDRGQLDALTRLCADEWSRHSVPSHEDSVYPIARRAADSVAAFPSIPPEYATQILNVATETSDSSVQDKLLSAVAAKGNDDARRAVADIVFRRRANWTSVSAAAAIAQAGSAVDPELLKPATGDWFLTTPPALAVPVAIAVGRCAAAIQVIEVAAALATSDRRRVLLVPLADGAAMRDDSLAERVLNMLPPGHGAKAILQPVDPNLKLPATSLDDLGEVRVVNHVLSAYSSRLEARSKAAHPAV